MTVRKPRIRNYNTYDFDTARYELKSGKEAIKEILNGLTPTMQNRFQRARRPIYLDELIPFSRDKRYGTYPAKSGWMSHYEYWHRKNAKNLTEEDRSYLRWLIRTGRLSDAPTKDLGDGYDLKKKKAKAIDNRKK